jgi:DNA polymerase III subunit epsilon
MNWHESLICGFDLETTGVDVFTDVPVQIGIQLSIAPGGNIVRIPAMSYERLVNPERPITNSDIHGITNTRVEIDGISVSEAVEELAWFLRAMVAARIPIVMFNAQFDWTMVRSLMDRGGIEWDLDDARILDPLVIDRHKDKYVKGSGQRKQNKVAARLGVEISGTLHTAADDANLAVDIARAQGRKYPELAETLQDQESWARIQQSELQSYFTRSGRKDPDGSPIVIATGWPLRDHPEWQTPPVDVPTGVRRLETM